MTATFVACFFIFSANFTASERYRYLMADGYDTQTYVTHKILSRATQSGPGIVVLGTSVTIRCIESESNLSALVEKASGTHLATYDLATDAQSIWEMIAITDQRPPGPGGVLVVGLSPGLLALDADGPGKSALTTVLRTPKLGFTSSAMETEARYLGLSTPIRTGIYAIDNANFLISRRKVMLKNLLRGGVDYADPLTAPWYEQVNTPAFWKQEIADLPKLVASYDLNIRSNLDAIHRMIARARKYGEFSIVILESPVHPGWWDTPLGAEFHNRYRADLIQLANQLGGTVMLATKAAGLKRSDFVDYEGHLGNTDARARCSKALAEAIATTIGGSRT